MRPDRHFSRLLLGLTLALLASSCTATPTPDGELVVPPSTETVQTTTTTEPPTTTTTIEPTTTTIDPILEQIEAMTLEDKIGQMLMPVLRGTGALTASAADRSYNLALGGAETPAELVIRYRLGGVMYLGPNVESPAQIATFSAELQQAAGTAGLPPMFIAADQEGGRVLRVKGEGITPIGSARSLAGDRDAVFQAGAITGTEMVAIGVNVVFAPVADVVRSDVGVIGNRSYGSDPIMVGEMVVAMIDGLQQGGVGAVAKHWPGHGATEVDSHQALPTVTSTEEEWRRTDLPPFQRAVEAGVDAMMVGHLALPNLDPVGQPATISPILTDALVRNDLQFAGVLFTDAMDMRALDGIAEGELAVRVIEAGLDILLVPPDLSAAVAGIMGAIETGRLDETRLDRSVERILRMKGDLGLL
ncbi:MAG: hypothetical protein HKN03_18790 [Acidimicrobiales bacterium]|nr:hypothetical protein [Acidimicrobiales bacterium]